MYRCPGTGIRCVLVEMLGDSGSADKSKSRPGHGTKKAVCLGKSFGE